MSATEYNNKPLTKSLVLYKSSELPLAWGKKPEDLILPDCLDALSSLAAQNIPFREALARQVGVDIAQFMREVHEYYEIA